MRSVFAMLTLAAALVPARAAEAEEPLEPGRASGGLTWIFSEELDLSGTMSAQVPLAVAARGAVVARFDLRTAIERSLGDFTFAVRDVDYRAEVAARVRRGFELFVGRRGLERVDVEGQSRATYAGTGWSSAGWDAALPSRSWEGTVSLAAVVERSRDRSDALARGALRYTRGRGSWAWGFDARGEAWARGSRLRADLEAGPRLDLRLAGGRGLALRLGWYHGRSPFGLGVSGVVAGFEIVEGPWTSAPRPTPPEVRGVVAFGAGDDGRLSGRIRVAALSPPWGQGYRAVIDVDAKALTARDTGELFYLYHVGVERSRSEWVWGIYLHHRSNHVLAENNPIGVTSRNVVEIGAATAGWDDPRPPSPDRRGRIDASLRPGWTIDSSFDESPGACARGGIRWTIGAGPRAAPYLLFEGTTGEVESRLYAAGIVVGRSLDLRIAFTSDRQHFGRDRTAWILSAGLPF